MKELLKRRTLALSLNPSFSFAGARNLSSVATLRANSFGLFRYRTGFTSRVEEFSEALESDYARTLLLIKEELAQAKKTLESLGHNDLHLLNFVDEMERTSIQPQNVRSRAWESSNNPLPILSTAIENLEQLYLPSLDEDQRLLFQGLKSDLLLPWGARPLLRYLDQYSSRITPPSLPEQIIEDTLKKIISLCISLDYEKDLAEKLSEAATLLNSIFGKEGAYTIDFHKIDIRKLEDHKIIAAKYLYIRAVFVSTLYKIREAMEQKKAPSCFISYAWDKENPLHGKITQQITEDLKTAGINVWFDMWHNQLTTSIAKFTEKLNGTDFVLVASTEKYKEKWMKGEGNVLWTEVDQIFRKYSKKPKSVIPAVLGKNPSNSLPDFLTSVYCNFHEDHYKAFFEVLTVLLKDIVPVEDFKDGFFAKESLILHQYERTTLLHGLENSINEAKKRNDLLKEQIENDFSQFGPNGNAAHRKT